MKAHLSCCMPALALLLLLAAPSVQSQGKDFTPSDLAMLPEVCTVRLRGARSNQETLESTRRCIEFRAYTPLLLLSSS